MPEAAQVAYARRTIVNLFIDQQRRQARLRNISHLLRSEDVTAGFADDRSDRSLARSLVEGLPPRQRAAVILRYWSGLRDEEIAATLGCSTGTIKSQISRAMTSMRVELDRQHATGDLS